MVDKLRNLSVYPINQSLFVDDSSDGSIILDKAAPFIFWAISEEGDGPQPLTAVACGINSSILKGRLSRAPQLSTILQILYFQNQILNSK